MGGPDEKPDEYELDFRVGGREYNRGTPPRGGLVYTYEARYQDIVADERIVYAYEMYLDDARISVSVGTVQLAPAGPGRGSPIRSRGPTSTASTTPSSASRALQNEEEMPVPAGAH